MNKYSYNSITSNIDAMDKELLLLEEEKEKLLIEIDFLQKRLTFINESVSIYKLLIQENRKKRNTMLREA